MNENIKRAIAALDHRIESIALEPETMISGELTMALGVILSALKNLSPEERQVFEQDMMRIQAKIKNLSQQVSQDIEGTKEDMQSLKVNLKAISAYERTGSGGN
jgi:hypothetical protein